MNSNIDILEKVQKVNPSPFLYQQILRKIEFQKKNISQKEVLIIGIPAVLFFILTCFLIIQRPNTIQSSNLLKGMHLVENNSLY